ncbi:hypothetical protein ABXJ76_06790 [Methylobacter sp. G7]|uniref:hypothetical protein n=1 Tax=Methylobacter sp. G7 TaxID=3230117 RepID=UPI003D808AE7
MNSKLSPADAVRFINTWLNRNGYAEVFKGNVDTALRENRRVSRASNNKKYGCVPYWKNERGRAFYELEDLQALCEERLKPICAKALAIKLAKASGLKYYSEAA